MLDQGGKEYTKGVFGQSLSKTDPPAEAVGDESFLLDKLPGSIVGLLKEPLREKGCGLLPVVWVLRTQKGQENQN